MGHYDRDGKVISLDRWIELSKEFDYRRVAYTTLKNGLRVSTVWLGLDHSFGSGKPVIFETMVFPRDSMGEIDCERYSTEEEARAGHAYYVDEYDDDM